MINKIIFSAICFLVSFGAIAQPDLPEKIVASLDSFSLFRPQEKTYVQTDRNQYVAGETIWFNAYALLQSKPTILSKVVYVDLLDRSGKVIEKKMLPLNEGIAAGSIETAGNLLSGSYLLRCYTLWMLNFPDFIPVKPVSIVNTSEPAKENLRSPALYIEFFPEGGQLVNGLKSIVAFKAVDEYGRPVDVSGDIVNEKNEKLQSFKTSHNGMGSFELVAAPGSYRAIVRPANGAEKTFPLPTVKEEGITLSVDNSNPNRAFVKVERAEKNKDRYNKFLVLAQLNYQVAYMGELNLDENLDAAAINKKNLSPGIMQITVLAENGQPLAERLLFVGNHGTGQGSARDSIVNLEKRKKNIISIDATGFTGLKAAVSVTNAEEFIPAFGPNILSTILLTSDLKGRIDDPGYYFKDKDPVTLQHLDLVMLINGWRRFKLDELLVNKYPPLSYPFETGLSVTGKVFESNGKTPLSSGKINLIVRGVDSTHILSEATTNTASAFVVPGLTFSKEAMIYYQGTNVTKSGAIVSVKIDSTYFDTLNRAVAVGYLQQIPPPNGSFAQKRLAEKEKLDSFQGKTLGEVVVKSKRLSETDSLNALYASDMFHFSDQTLVLDERINYFDIWQFLRMKVAGIAINETDTGTQVNFTRYTGLDLFSENTNNSSVQFFLNEVPVSLQIVEGLHPSDIAMVKIFKGVTAITLGADRGAIALYTHKGRSTRDWRQKGFDFFKRSGYSVTREFYVMDYSNINPENNLSDIRPTLYWNPSVNFKDGRAVIEFYNDDISKKARVTIEGVDAQGKLLHVVKWIE